MTMTSQVGLEASPTKKEVYSDPAARKIMEYLLRNLRTVIVPEIHVNDEIAYPQIEPIIGASIPDAVGLLAPMAEVGVLAAELVDKSPRCPECGSQQLSTRYLCPRCFSYDVTRSYLYEHLKCGKVASDESFMKGEQLVCPKCQIVLHEFGVEYRAVGAWYKCNYCSESFNLPTHSHFCRPHRHQFTSDRARLVPIYQYTLNQKILPEIRREVLLYSEAISMLENLGLTVLAPHSLPGKSGEPQNFDIVVVVAEERWRGRKMIALDVINSDTKVGTDTVRSFAAKVKDAKPAESYLLAAPGLTEEARGLAKNLKIAIVEGASLKEAMGALGSRGAFKGLLA